MQALHLIRTKNIRMELVIEKAGPFFQQWKKERKKTEKKIES